MKVGKPKSKRVPVRLRHKIEKASTAKQRKQRKEAKKNPQWRSRIKKDPGVPNLFPYKAQVLAEIEEGRRKKEEEAQSRRDIAKAQRQGRTVAEVRQDGAPARTDEVAEDEDSDELLSDQDGVDLDEDEDMDDDATSNPMAALLASAQARAQAHPQDDTDDVDEAKQEDEWQGIDGDNGQAAPRPRERKVLPKQALADPIKAVSALLDRMQKTTDGIRQIIEYYQIPPLVTAGSDITSRFLVEVARKRGRLGRGGVPNLHSAALTVLGDLNDERLVLPAVVEEPASKATAPTGKSEVRVVTKMAEPFRIDGLWGNESAPVTVEDNMAVEV